jgi:hypothetical protein
MTDLTGAEGSRSISPLTCNSCRYHHPSPSHPDRRLELIVVTAATTVRRNLRGGVRVQRDELNKRYSGGMSLGEGEGSS